MSKPTAPPSFADFTRWLAYRETLQTASTSSAGFQTLLSAARAARDETLQAGADLRAENSRTPSLRLEVLKLLAAASTDAQGARPPELTTARGFRVTLSYDEGDSATPSSICVLVRCPPELVERLRGEMAYLWNGSERFELGQFDAEGKAIGTLPAGIQIALADFTQGRVKLEAPAPGED